MLIKNARLVILIKNIRSSRLVILIRNIRILWDRKPLLDSDPDQEYILYGVGNAVFFMGSETLPPPVTYFPFTNDTCYILADESSIPFYVTSERVNAEISETTRKLQYWDKACRGARLSRYGVRFLSFLRSASLHCCWHTSISFWSL